MFFDISFYKFINSFQPFKDWSYIIFFDFSRSVRNNKQPSSRTETIIIFGMIVRNNLQILPNLFLCPLFGFREKKAV